MEAMASMCGKPHRGMPCITSTGNHETAVGKELRQEAEKLLREEQWSPEHISGHLKLQGKYISHETIYKMIRKDKMGRR